MARGRRPWEASRDLVATVPKDLVQGLRGESEHGAGEVVEDLQLFDTLATPANGVQQEGVPPTAVVCDGLRLACVRMQNAPLASLVRRDPELATQPVIVVEGRGSHARVVACTESARAMGVSLRQTLQQVRARAPDVVIRPYDPLARLAAQQALADAASSLAAKVESDGDRVYLEISELRRLYQTEAGFVAAMTEAARRVGLAVDIGVADTKGVAALAASWSHAARGEGGGWIVPPGGARAFVAQVPVAALPMSPSLRKDLQRLGVVTTVALAELPLEAMATRLGPEVARAIALARGEDPTPLFPRVPAMSFEEATELDWEVTDVTALLFVLKRLVDALVERLACRSLAAGGVRVVLKLLSRQTDERTLPVAVPTRDVATLVHLARASLEARPPPDAVVAMKLVGIAAPPRPMQLGLFDPPKPSPEKMTLTLARLTALVGEGRVGIPVVPDTHRPHAVEVGAFVHAWCAGEMAATRTKKPSLDEIPVALHVFRPPRPAEVTWAGEQLVSVQAGEIRGGVRRTCGPFRVAGHWWSDRFDHEGYDVQLDDGMIYLLGCDRTAGTWWVEGMYA